MTRKNFEYNPQEIEPKWQKRWADSSLFHVDRDTTKPKKYCLAMFPYPSGRIHMGHVRNYSIGDVMARFFRMQGYNVLHPMGWDAFGLPAENAAIQKGVHPKIWTYENIAAMKAQMNRLGVSFDWRREVTTCDPEYYRWEQSMFLRMHREGLAYREKRALNWCPSCETVLANEEVVDGLCWRCDSKVIIREMDQWFLRITKYAEELLHDIEQLEQWPDRVRIMQQNWIGKSEGCEIDFALEKSPSTKIRVFTTRPDTIYGVTALILAPEHPLADLLSRGTEQEEAFQAFLADMKKMDRTERASETAEKQGCFTGGYAAHPLTGEKVPIWVANFVVTDYGTGALMAVPAHDTRDFAFAQKYALPVKKVVQQSATTQKDSDQTVLPFTEDGWSVHSPGIEGLKTPDAKKKIVQMIVQKTVGQAKTNYRLRDWGISRQRYWGTPIPMIHCQKCGLVEVPESDLPVRLPDDVDFSGKGGSPLARHAEFINVKCPACQGLAQRESDTMSTFIESSWYYARFCGLNHQGRAVDKEGCAQWLPIDHYIGGVEHATGHLMYFRFFHKLMRDWGWIPGDEPAKQLICQGMVYKDGAKMSKSKGNVVDPDELVAKFGADTARLFVLFAGPIEKDLEWSDKGVEGCFRFLGRVYRLVMNAQVELEGAKAWDLAAQATRSEAQKLQRLIHKTIRNVTEDIQKDFHYNTAISFMMELVNALYLIDLSKADVEVRGLFLRAIETLVVMLSPFAPHVCDELWEQLGHGEFTLNVPWPEYSEKLAKDPEKEIVLQINGRVKDRLLCPDGLSNKELETRALASQKIQEALKGSAPKKVIVVPNRLVNIVV